MPHHRISTLFSAILGSLLLLVLSTSSVQAGMVSTERILSDGDLQRQAIVEQLQRDEVRSQLVELGVSAEHVHQRVERLTDAEVASLHQRLDSLPAGGRLSTVELLLIIILIVLLV